MPYITVDVYHDVDDSNLDDIMKSNKLYYDMNNNKEKIRQQLFSNIGLKMYYISENTMKKLHPKRYEFIVQFYNFIVKEIKDYSFNCYADYKSDFRHYRGSLSFIFYIHGIKYQTRCCLVDGDLCDLTIYGNDINNNNSYEFPNKITPTNKQIIKAQFLQYHNFDLVYPKLFYLFIEAVMEVVIGYVNQTKVREYGQICQ